MKSCLAAVLALLAWAAAPAAAATYGVTSPGNNGSGTLREAIDAANSTDEFDEIVFDTPAFTVEATSPLPAITRPVRIDGNGSRVSGSGLVAQAAPVYVTALGVAGGFSGSGPNPPGALRLRRASDGVLRLSGTLSAGGAVELLRSGGGEWAGALGTASAGAFTLPVTAEPPSGDTITATLTIDGSGTSPFAAPVGIGDLASPVLSKARTVDGDGDGLADTVRLTATEELADAAGFAGLALADLPVASVSTGEKPDDAEIDVKLVTPLAGGATPQTRVSANDGAADAAGNALLAGPTTPAVGATDGVAPMIDEAVALSRNTVRVRFNEPVRDITKDDFTLAMAGERALGEIKVAADGVSAELTATSEWPYATAGSVRISGRVSDAAGNASSGTPARVYAAPGDTVAPALSVVKLASTVICVRGISASCRKQGGTVSFTVNEPATIRLDLRRLTSKAVSSLSRDKGAGAGTISFGGRVEGRKLRVGRYRLTVTAIDAADNESKPVRLRFRVRR